MIKPISKTAVTSNTSVSELDNSSLSEVYSQVDFSPYYRMNLSPEHATILGTRYLDNQPQEIVSIYRTGISRAPHQQFKIFFEELPYESCQTSNLYWYKIGQNPKNSDFDEHIDGQFILLKKSIFMPGEVSVESIEQTEDIPRHLVCTYIGLYPFT